MKCIEQPRKIALAVPRGAGICVNIQAGLEFAKLGVVFW